MKGTHSLQKERIIEKHSNGAKKPVEDALPWMKKGYAK